MVLFIGDIIMGSQQRVFRWVSGCVRKCVFVGFFCLFCFSWGKYTSVIIIITKLNRKNPLNHQVTCSAQLVLHLKHFLFCYFMLASLTVSRLAMQNTIITAAAPKSLYLA